MQELSGTVPLSDYRHQDLLITLILTYNMQSNGATPSRIEIHRLRHFVILTLLNFYFLYSRPVNFTAEPFPTRVKLYSHSCGILEIHI